MEKDIELIPLREEHLETVRNWRNSGEVSAFMYTDTHITSSEQLGWYGRISSDPTCRYWIISYENRHLGVVSVTEISRVFDSCFWAFYLGDSSVRGAGIGAKVEYNILKYVFEDLGLNKLRCEVFTFNEKVISMHEKFGFRREAYYREHVCKGGVYHDVVGLAMLKREWKQLKDYHYNRIYNR